MLVIDDQPSVCASLVYLLELAGFKTLKAEGGTAAMTLIETEPFDGALIDIHMPGMDGFALCQRLQAHARTTGRELRVWFMTGAKTRLHAQRSAELGAFGVLSKPFEYHELIGCLRAGFAAPIPQPIPPKEPGT